MSVLIIKLGALGDCIQAEGAVRDVRAHHPDDRLLILTGTAHAALWDRCPHLDGVIPDPRRPRWRLDTLWQLKAALDPHSVKRVYDLQNSGRTAFYRRVLLPRAQWSGRAAGARWHAPHGNREGVPIHQRLCGQLAAAGVPTAYCAAPDLSWLAADADMVLRHHDLAPPYIVLLPGSSTRGAHKRWPHYARLADLLTEAGHRVVTIPGPGEQPLCRTIPARMIGGDPPLTLAELAAVLSRAAFVIGNDSGPSHLAACLGVPGLALFGAHMPAKLTGIERPGFAALQAEDLSEITAESVFQRVIARQQ